MPAVVLSNLAIFSALLSASRLLITTTSAVCPNSRSSSVFHLFWNAVLATATPKHYPMLVAVATMAVAINTSLSATAACTMNTLLMNGMPQLVPAMSKRAT